MSTLAFFPWFKLDHEVALTTHRLVPFGRGERPGGEDQLAIDAVLEPFMEGENRPIQTGTLLVAADQAFTADLDEEAIDDYFELAELIAFAGLSGRTYFGIGSKYANRETFQLVIQRFADPSGGVAVTTRRRDGSTTAYVSRSQYKVRRPTSQYGVSTPTLDEGLLRALVSLRDRPEFPGFAEAIYFFNLANSDSDGASEQAETISMVSAYERLLDCRSGKEDHLAEQLVAAWHATAPYDPSECERIPADRRGRSILESWIRDAFQHRGFHAHGRRTARHAALWTPREHLLLGAYAYPLLVKQELVRMGAYTLTDDDQLDIDLFEPLACPRHFEPPASDDDMPKYPWNEIRSDASWKRAWERSSVAARIEALIESGELGDGDSGAEPEK